MKFIYIANKHNIITIGEHSVHATKIIEATHLLDCSKIIYIMEDRAFIRAFLHHQVSYDFHDAKWRDIRYEELFEQYEPKISRDIDSSAFVYPNDYNTHYSNDLTIDHDVKKPFFLFAELSCELSKYVLPKFIKLLQSKNNPILVFIKRPFDFSFQKIVQRAESVFDDLMNLGVSMIINDLPLKSTISEVANYKDVYLNNEYLISQSYLGIQKLLEYSFEHPDTINTLLSFFYQQELLLFGYSIANSITQIETAIESAKKQILPKLKRFESGTEIESYSIIISYFSNNTEHFVNNLTTKVKEISSEQNTCILRQATDLTGEQLSIHLFGRIRTNRDLNKICTN